MNDEKKWVHSQLRACSRPTIWWVVLMAICTVATLLTYDNLGPPSFSEILFISSCVSLLASIGVWLAIGARWWRIPVLFAAWVIIVLLLMQTNSGDLQDLPIMGFFGMLVVGVVALPIFLFRKFKNGTLAKPSSHEAAVKEVLQFSVFHLLALMTAVAVLISVGRWLIPLLSGNDNGIFFAVSKLGITLSLGSLVAVWATLGNFPGLRTVVSTMAIAAIAGLSYFLVDESPIPWVYPALTIIVWLQITALMWCLRCEGFRFITRPRTTSISI